MFTHYVYSMITVLLLFVWLSMFIGGIGLLFASKYFNTGTTLITFFLLLSHYYFCCSGMWARTTAGCNANMKNVDEN